MLDLRFPIGLFFCINSLVLIAVGFFQPQGTRLGDWVLNLNLTWGLVMAVFGAFMLILYYSGKNSQSE
ncbi:MAG: hypothetical protein K2W82_10290 [Candidatus Obscuribacterales bacterium]|nr:hypothetical protein [Candidatus Obscuribacterales bacterium]